MQHFPYNSYKPKFTDFLSGTAFISGQLTSKSIVMKWLWNGYETTMKGLKTVMNWLWNGDETAMKRLWNGYETVMKQLWNGYETVTGLI